MNSEKILDDISFNNDDELRKDNLPPLKSGKYLIIVKLEDGRELDFYSDTCTIEPMLGNAAYIDNKRASDGRYIKKGKRNVLEVKSGRFVRRYKYDEYKVKGLGIVLIIETEEPYGVEKGNPVFIDGVTAYDGRYKVGWLNWIEVEDGKVFDFLLV